mgnify:CR=1 FL=1
MERDSAGRLKKVDISDDEVKNRANYQKNDVINYLDGDSSSGVYYGYGTTSLISDHSRVIKGGSWNDRPYWLSPGSRRFMEETQSSSTVGFRCAQTYLGPPEGPEGPVGPVIPGAPCGPWSCESSTATCGVMFSITIIVVTLLPLLSQ